MSPQDQLTVEGTFLEHPFAELLSEIAQVRLDGSLRVADRDRKCVFYFKKGRVAMAVSNSRSMRVFEMLLARNRLTRENLVSFPDIANDFELVGALIAGGLINPDEREGIFADQIDAILLDTISWPNGTWSFNALARLRDGLVFDIKTGPLLSNYARCLAPQDVLGRFRSDEETFVASESADFSLALQSEESAVCRIVVDRPRSIREIAMASGVGETRAIHALYTLWIAGLLERGNWTPAFDRTIIEKMNGARLELKQEAKYKAQAAAPPSRDVNIGETLPAAPANNAPQPQMSLDDYLARSENADTFYDLLGVETDADAGMIKKAYFNLARSFHPDHFHQEEAATIARVQKAFTDLTKAHETLKDPALRESYNFKVRKELEEKRKNVGRVTPDERSLQLAQALDNFERGFSHLMENDTESALPYLARAVHYDPNNARFHAYFGKALSADKTKRHRAESEMQAALRLDPQNPTYKIMLAEFFVQMKLFKRAEGELNRLLAVFPSNREARDLLNSIRANV